MTNRGTTAHYLYSKIFMAQQINQWSGANVKPWELEDIPYEWLLAFHKLENLPKIREHNQKVEQYMQEAMRKHPTFRKH